MFFLIAYRKDKNAQRKQLWDMKDFKRGQIPHSVLCLLLQWEIEIFQLLFLSFLSQEEEMSDSDLGQGQNEFLRVIIGKQHWA